MSTFGISCIFPRIRAVDWVRIFPNTSQMAPAPRLCIASFFPCPFCHNILLCCQILLEIEPRGHIVLYTAGDSGKVSKICLFSHVFPYLFSEVYSSPPHAPSHCLTSSLFQIFSHPHILICLLCYPVWLCPSSLILGCKFWPSMGTPFVRAHSPQTVAGCLNNKHFFCIKQSLRNDQCKSLVHLMSYRKNCSKENDIDCNAK